MRRELDGPAQELLGLVVVGRRGRGLARPLQELGLLGRVGRDRERLAQEDDGLLVRAEGRGALGCGRQGDARLDGEGVRLRSRGRVLVGREVVAREDTRQLVGTERLEEAGGGEMARPCGRAWRACCRRPRG